MSELSQIQGQFLRYILTGQSEIHHAIVETNLVSIDTRLGIYRDAYRLRLIESLTLNFPALYAYLGYKEFSNLTTYYIDANPSSYRSIRWYGHLLPEFIKTTNKCHESLAELADFEWNMTLAFDAADAQRINVEDMAKLSPQSWANLQFVMHPSLIRTRYFWNAVSLWQVLTQNLSLPKPKKNKEAIEWVLWRNQENIIKFYSLSQNEAWALDSLIKGVSFGTLCEGLCQWINPEEVSMYAASYLKGWIQNGMISKMSQ